jgi:hypothetical protein
MRPPGAPRAIALSLGGGVLAALLAVGACVPDVLEQGDPCTAASLDDGNPCTVDSCAAGKPPHEPEPDGLACSLDGAPGACRAGACDVVACDPTGPEGQCNDENPCTLDACDPTTSYCAWSPLHGTPTPDAKPIVGDCKQRFCIEGTEVELADPDDLPQDAACVDEACSPEGEPLKAPSAAGTPCGQLTCDGNGVCSGCSADGQCPGDTCNTPVCNADTGTCTTAPAGTGIPVPDVQQTPNDCQVLVCDDAGNIVSITDPNDAPLPDSEPCTLDMCVGGTPQHPPAAAGTGCSLGVCNPLGECVECLYPIHCYSPGVCFSPTCDRQGLCGLSYEPAGTPCGSGACDAEGSCVGCTNDDECGMGTDCVSHKCQSGSCSVIFAPAGTQTAAQSGGDCMAKVCDGSGGITSATDNLDVPSDGNDCTVDTCVGGSPSFQPAMAGVACSMGTKVCNGSGGCVGCVTTADCPAPSSPCKQSVCNAGVCGETNLPQFTACGPGQQCNTNGICKIANGEPCPADKYQCASTKCRDGVCCENSCSQHGCVACIEAYTGSPDGDCDKVIDGTDPHDFCPGTEVCHWRGPSWSCGPP